MVGVCVTASLMGGEFQVKEIPAGCNLQAYDDCGVINRQPRIVEGQVYLFPEDKVDGSERVRTVCYGNPNIKADYHHLKKDVDYFIAITYVTDAGNKRVQRLHANSILLHDSYVLPEIKAEKLFFRIPAQEIAPDGTLRLTFECKEGPNAVVSEIELWASIPSPTALYLDVIPGIYGELAGSVHDLRWQPVGDTEVIVKQLSTGITLATVKTDKKGEFFLDGGHWRDKPRSESIAIKVAFNASEATATKVLDELYLACPIIRPIPKEINGEQLMPLVIDGTWRLAHPIPERFPEIKMDGTIWKELKVPGQLLQQGFEIPDDDKIAVFREFDIPRSWLKNRIFLRFDSIHASAQYWLNEKYLGSSEHLYTPVEFEITQTAKAGRNILTVKMQLDSVSEQLSHTSKYAFHSLLGIDRSVSVFALPSLFVETLHINTELDGDYRNADLVVDAQLDVLAAPMSKKISLAVSLYDRHETVVAIAESEFAKGVRKIQIKMPVKNPHKWNSEKPYLYTLKAKLIQDGKAIEQIERKIGFRKIEVQRGRLLVNGKPVTLAGANRHEIDPLSGRADTVKHAKKDAELFKAANINYIRTSHYPPTHEFLDACDQIGLYVEVEAPFCWTRTKRQWEEDQNYASYFMRPTALMVEYNRNHPSVTLWSLGNESGYAPHEEKYDLPTNYIKTLEFCRRSDTSRPVCFNNEWARDGKRCDIATLHYQDPPFKSLPYLQEDPRPIILDEYWHIPTYEPTELSVDPGVRVQWGSFGSLDQTIWNRLLNTSNVIGGAIWGGIDEIFFLPKGKKVGYGPWGIIDSWRREKPEYWLAKCIYSPVWIPIDRVDYKKGDAFIQIPVENRYSFTNMNELKTRWQIGNKTGEISVELVPLSKGQISIPVSVDQDIKQPIVLRFFDEKEWLVAAKTVYFGDSADIDLPIPGSGRPQIKEDEGYLTITGKTFRMKIDKQNVRIVPDSSGITVLAFPRIHATRKEVGWLGTSSPYAEYPDLTTRKIEFIGVEIQEDALAVTVRDEYDGFKGYVKWLIDDMGQTKVSFNYNYTGSDVSVRELGVRFLMDKNCQTLRWKRKGDWSPFPDDHIGRTEGIAKAFYDAEKKTKAGNPDWPWSYDSTERGSNDFRSSKFNIYNAEICDKAGRGLKVNADGSVNVRASVAEDGVQFHVLKAVGAQLTKNSILEGDFYITLTGK
jgi:hypothetical protein